MQLFLLHRFGTLRLTCALREEASIAYWCPSFGPSDKSHMCEYDASVTDIVILASLRKHGSWTLECRLYRYLGLVYRIPGSVGWSSRTCHRINLDIHILQDMESQYVDICTWKRSLG
jgi:hypothetical protein